MKVLHRYVAAEILTSTVFALVAFLSLFAFFDLIAELPRVGRGSYELQHAFLYVAMNLPAYVYDLMPIAALIGTIYTLAQLAARSEFTIMRASGLSTGMAGWMLARVGIVLVLVTFLFGEFIAPASSEYAEKFRLAAQESSISREFRSGLWTKDVIRSEGMTGENIGSRFLNVGNVTPDGQLRRLKVYEFDRDMQLRAVITAGHADYRGNNVWRFVDVAETSFAPKGSDLAEVVSSRKHATYDVVSEITPEILSVLVVDPERMSALSLATYTRHLEDNSQNAERYEIAFWKKLFYPLAVMVMMALALPFAYLHFRSGGVSLKIFIGVMIGVSFQLINSLFSHIGLLNTWPPVATALLPSVLFLLVAMGALAWVQKH
ncbi:LPS export ABC transporter permease LptG [Noviherbaspirillum aridicola]|uniref:LPS export ABC transporter permease LptG n=1 Tax=Noviherbaspirillum aridicola TaxID=2849687 RepID=A0ABQ4Q4I8_9BURK|nr:LPS export ABC transporter permease LptG [Noviherbaspirillum aridicola]GIZ52111.1 LPS export ABC transporter permease LptG [Noviherbaspirillum aridicola]